MAGRGVVRRHDVVLTEGAGGLHAATTSRHPVDRVQGTTYRGRVGIRRRLRRMIVGSRVENMLAYPGSFSFSVSELFRGNERDRQQNSA